MYTFFHSRERIRFAILRPKLLSIEQLSLESS